MTNVPTNIRRAVLSAAACMAALGLFGGQVLADSRHHDDDRNQRADQGSRMTLDEAVQRAERRYHARVVKAESRNSDGRTVYVLRLVSDDGRVFTVRVDAQTGNMD